MNTFYFSEWFFHSAKYKQLIRMKNSQNEWHPKPKAIILCNLFPIFVGIFSFNRINIFAYYSNSSMIFWLWRLFCINWIQFKKVYIDTVFMVSCFFLRRYLFSSSATKEKKKTNVNETCSMLWKNLISIKITKSGSRFKIDRPLYFLWRYYNYCYYCRL